MKSKSKKGDSIYDKIIVAKKVAKEIPELTYNDLVYLLDDQTENVRTAFENKDNIELVGLGAFEIKSTRSKALEFRKDYLEETGIDIDDLTDDKREEVISDIDKKRRVLNQKVRSGENIETVRKILKKIIKK